jgi:hypothetical protein
VIYVPRVHYPHGYEVSVGGIASHEKSRYLTIPNLRARSVTVEITPPGAQ